MIRRGKVVDFAFQYFGGDLSKLTMRFWSLKHIFNGRTSACILSVGLPLRLT